MIDKTLTDHKRMGFFEVGQRRFFNRTDALSETKGKIDNIYFNFNDDAFSKIDWSLPISDSLSELYKKRALQIREKYDYVSLFFSGGVDSGNILKTFIDNNILLDEVVMMRTGISDKLKNKIDRSSDNAFSEIYYAAVPYLNMFIKDTRTKIRYVDIDVMTNTFLNNDNLVEQYRTSLGLLGCNSITKIAMSVLDNDWNNMYEKGLKVCHLQGTDKPWFDLEGVDKLYFSFKDTPTWKIEAKFDTSSSIMLAANQHQECFYWTPDLPELLIKQCQVIREKFNTDKDFRRLVVMKKIFLKLYTKALNETIYPKDVMMLQDLFLTEKVSYKAGFAPNNWVEKSLDAKALYNYDSLFKETVLMSGHTSGDWKNYFSPILKAKKYYF